jgi:hypothetical protein
VRSRLAWLLGIAGLVAFLRRRRAPRPALEPAPDERALELRRVLDESRQEEPAPPEPEAPATEPLEDRRRQVHDAGRAAIDEIRGSATPAE